MNVNFAQVLAALGALFAFRMAQGLRPGSLYLFNQVLPERNRPTYHVEDGDITIRPTMAGLAAMDSPYPPGSSITVTKFLEQTAKIAQTVPLSERAQRELHQYMMLIARFGSATVADGTTISSEAQLIRNTIISFIQNVVVQAQWDTAEWLRGQALANGVIDWQYGNLSLEIDYGVPSDNLFTTRTGGDAYGGSTSVFWADHRNALRLLPGGVERIIAHPDTINDILYNQANNLEILSDANNSFRVRRLIGNAGEYQRASSDSREALVLQAYGLEGEVIDPDNTSETIKVPFMPKGKIIYQGRANADGLRVGMGSVDDPNASNALGYTHIGPTVEGGSQPGRWARVYTPQDRPYELRADSVSNLLPVITEPKKLVVLSTDLQA